MRSETFAAFLRKSLLLYELRRFSDLLQNDELETGGQEQPPFAAYERREFYQGDLYVIRYRSLFFFYV